MRPPPGRTPEQNLSTSAPQAVRSAAVGAACGNVGAGEASNTIPAKLIARNIHSTSLWNSFGRQSSIRQTAQSILHLQNARQKRALPTSSRKLPCALSTASQGDQRALA